MPPRVCSSLTSSRGSSRGSGGGSFPAFLPGCEAVIVISFLRLSFAMRLFSYFFIQNKPVERHRNPDFFLFIIYVLLLFFLFYSIKQQDVMILICKT